MQSNDYRPLIKVLWYGSIGKCMVKIWKYLVTRLLFYFKMDHGDCRKTIGHLEDDLEYNIGQKEQLKSEVKRLDKDNEQNKF